MEPPANNTALPRWQMNNCERRAVSSLSVVIPALNEKDAIGQAVDRCLRVLGQMDLEHFEVIVVDDGSQDRTGEIAAEHGALVRRHPANAGYGRSLKDGIISAQYDTIVITDGDGTYPVEAIPRMLEEYCKGVNLVVGRRRGEHLRESVFGMPLRRVLKFLVEFAAGLKIPDINSGLRIFSRSEIIPYFRFIRLKRTWPDGQP